MTYDQVATISQATSLLLFVTMFLVVLAYALWPSNGPRFDKLQQQALDFDKNKSSDNERGIR